MPTKTNKIVVITTNAREKINQSKHISIAPYVASESEAHKLGLQLNITQLFKINAIGLISWLWAVHRIYFLIDFTF